ncbi:PilZ domain-containing protein [Halopseudomonas salina]|uniref:PilZ domain-containing protein n=1 Tax=Halopseudomonas salina TaxID=1323744 RepID=A0ABQ1PBY8_9GAMM|nr:PilZ domain-containing protein [Halopseudomonas salina]GGC94228.1 PilZ domain-containing protein [Halopseudomonas salina]
MSNQRQHPRTPMKCRIRISHPDIGDVYGQTRDLSDGGVFVENPDLAALAAGTIVEGQVQDMPIEAPILKMIIQRRIAGEGAGLAFVDDEEDL